MFLWKRNLRTNISILTIVLIYVGQFLSVQSVVIHSEESPEQEGQHDRREAYLKILLKMNKNTEDNDEDYILDWNNESEEEEDDDEVHNVDEDEYVDGQYEDDEKKDDEHKDLWLWKRDTQNRVYAEKFAPELRFDHAAKGYPMSAQVYYNGMKKDTSKTFRRENTDQKTLSTGNIPTYYMIRTDGKQTRILYWWFYGYENSCEANKGSHNGDWEHIMVILTEDKSQVAAVSFYQFNNHYTRISGSRTAPCIPAGKGRCSGAAGFESNGIHPIVYVGKTAHGSFHNPTSAGVTDAGKCADYADFRNPKSSNDYMQTWKKLVDLDGNEEVWIALDKKGGFSWGLNGVAVHPTQKNPFDQEHSLACQGHTSYALESIGCSQSECLAGDDETLEGCLKECELGFKNRGSTCIKGFWNRKKYDRLSKGKHYSYDYILPKVDAGLSHHRETANDWNLP
ncbi:hypothetical protein I4U23_004779 [Adineta vaga]|nr:hypothetical protein I4U23_004779 [Adineta vaga]